MIATTQVLNNAQRNFLADYTDLSRSLIADLIQLIQRYTNADGIVPLSALPTVQNEAQDMTLRLYVDPERGAYSEDGTQSYSPYADTLKTHILSVTAGVVAGHVTWLNNRPDDVVSWLSRQTIVVNRTPAPFRGSNPLAQYDPFHRWVVPDDPNGWRLSDRVWQTGLETRRKIGEYLDYGIRNGVSSLRMSANLEQFLVPGEKLRTTNKPYGTTASFSGMRLARTEIARAHTEALFVASRANPYVTGIDWRLSPRHPKFDVCDKLATIGTGGERIREPYPIESAPYVVEDSHPQCLCANSSAVEDTRSITERIRAVMLSYDNPPSIVPINLSAFLVAMLGAELAMQAQRFFEGV